jgi:hypothetical protein
MQILVGQAKRNIGFRIAKQRYEKNMKINLREFGVKYSNGSIVQVSLQR